MRHILSALVQNVPGVLAHISGMLASRGFNIISLAVGETEQPELSRMTFVVGVREDQEADRVLEQARKQLEKVVTVVKVEDLSAQNFVERDLMLLRVDTQKRPLSDLKQLVEIFRGRIVDVADSEVMVEISGPERKIEAFVDLMKGFGILQLVRAGRIALVRGSSQIRKPPEVDPNDD